MPPPVPRRFILIAAATAGLVVLVGVGFLSWIGTSRGLVPVRPASPNDRDIQELYVVIGAFASFIFLVVTVPLAVFVVRFRSGGRPRDEDGPQIRGHGSLELAWTVVPILILIAIATFTFVRLSGISNAPAASNALDVKVIGRQFYWQYEYPNGVIAIDRLRAPVGRVVNLTIVAPIFDVNHSWWVPELGGKRDAIPGVTNHTWFQATRTGVFEGRCAELCGVQHAFMRTSVEAMPGGVFDRWLASQASAQRRGASALGGEIFEGVCATCHGDHGQGGYARKIDNNAIFDDPAATKQLLEQGVQNGTRVMPPVGRDWSALELQAAVRYLRRNLGPQTAGGGTTTSGG
jgi:cytochrome c oxidase subunit 2